MPVTYDVDSNYLTNPPSHYPRVKPIDTLELEDLARQINLHNPNMPVNSILAVLNLFVDEVRFQLTEGNWVKIENFCSFATSITDAVMANPSDPLPAGYKIEVKAKPAAPFKQAIRDSASVSRDGIIAKVPSISSAEHALYGLNNIVQASVGLNISGKHIGFDQLDALQGVFITPDGGSETAETNIVINKPSNVSVIPSVTPQAAGATAAILAVKSKYTENGQLKEGVYTKKIRMVNTAAALDPDQDLFKPYGAAANCNFSTTVGNHTYLLRVRISNLNEMFFSGKLLTDGVWGDWGAEVEAVAGVNTVPIEAVNFTIDVTDLPALFAQVNADGRYIAEMVTISA